MRMISMAVVGLAILALTACGEAKKDDAGKAKSSGSGSTAMLETVTVDVTGMT